MHPILASRDRLALYLLAWIPIGALVALVLAGGGLGWTGAAALAVPLTLVYAFVCLASYYLCRAVPLGGEGALRPLASHLAAAGVSSWLWVLAGVGFARAIGASESRAAVAARYADRMPLLFVIGTLLFLLAIAIHYVMIALEASRRAEQRALRLRMLATEAELKALRSQVDPHFLFNCLHSISALTVSDSASARRMCVLLGDFLRQSLRLGGQDVIPLGDELALVDQFLAIERVRYGTRLSVEREIDPETRDCLVPPLLLQPLAENAVTHGIGQLTEGGAISIRTARSTASVTVVVENPCDPDRPAGRGTGLGLKNVSGRLATLYGREARVDVEERDGRFRVELRFPASTGTGSNDPVVNGRVRNGGAPAAEAPVVGATVVGATGVAPSVRG